MGGGGGWGWVGGVVFVKFKDWSKPINIAMIKDQSNLIYMGVRWMNGCVAIKRHTFDVWTLKNCLPPLNQPSKMLCPPLPRPSKMLDPPRQCGDSMCKFHCLVPKMKSAYYAFNENLVYDVVYISFTFSDVMMKVPTTSSCNSCNAIVWKHKLCYCWPVRVRGMRGAGSPPPARELNEVDIWIWIWDTADYLGNFASPPWYLHARVANTNWPIRIAKLGQPVPESLDGWVLFIP